MVEDDWLVRDMIVGPLEDAGYRILEADTAEQAVEILAQAPVNLLFTDIRLPGAMDGWELAEEARRIAADLPVVYATGFTQVEPRLVPNAVFLRKPYLPSQVIDVFSRLLGDVEA